MKKIILIGVGVVVAAVIALVIVLSSSLDGMAKRAVESVGPKITKVEVKLDSVSLSPISGSGKVNGLVVGNPEGFKAPSAIRVGSATLAIQPSSLFSDKVIIKTINVEGPEITFETDLRANNLSKLLANINETTGGGKESQVEKEEPKAARKLQVNEFIVTGAKVNVSLTSPIVKSATVTLPEIRLKDLGTGPEGITAASLTKEMLQVVLNKSIEAAAAAAADLAKGAVTGELNKAAGGALEKATEGLGGLLKKKK